jgi:hypothetical protein
MDFPRVLGIDADENLHKRGFTGAILPDKCVDFGLFKVEINLSEGMHARQALVYLLH